MTIDQFTRLNQALDQDRPDLLAVKEIIREQARAGSVDPILQGIANAMLAQDLGAELTAVHKVRAEWRGISWARNQDSRIHLENIP